MLKLHKHKPCGQTHQAFDFVLEAAIGNLTLLLAFYRAVRVNEESHLQIK